MLRMSIDADFAWAAFERRDRSLDGRFVGAVRTTRIYCKPSCPARRPKREHVVFYPNGEAARAAGYRACLRCRPDEVARNALAVARAVALLEGDDPPRLAALATAVGYAPHHFQRLFTRETGVSPAAYARRVRVERAKDALHKEDSVTDAIYAAGYNAPSRFYAEAGAALGMTPTAWRKGGAGVAIRYTVIDTELGPVLLAATEHGVCRLTFDTDVEHLHARFPKAALTRDDVGLTDLVAAVKAAFADPARAADVPVDVGGTAFQRAVWAALRSIPPGETRSYKDIAQGLGTPNGTRAVGQANGANGVAVLIPCHRVIAADKSLGGYAYGLELKRELLRRERGDDLQD